jgi:regulator of protease activity HflC (stomatin/prohibitin superfamily)
MLEKLIDFILETIEQIIPFKILKDYQEGVLFRFGRFRKVVKPGIQFKLPFFDDIEIHPVVYTTITLPPQSIVTNDGINVVIRGHIKYKIEDIKTFGVEVYDAIDALSDMTGGVIYEIIRTKTWEESYTSNLSSLITKQARIEAKKWGIYIEKVTITDYSKTPSLRLFNSEVLK